MDVHLTKAITIVVPSVFAVTVTNGLMLVTPRLHAAVAIVCVSVTTRARCQRGWDAGRHGYLVDMSPPPPDDLATPWDHPEDRRLFAGKWATSACALKPSTPAEAPCLTTASGVPFCPATMDPASHATSPRKVGGAGLATIPRRHGDGI